MNNIINGRFLTLVADYNQVNMDSSELTLIHKEFSENLIEFVNSELSYPIVFRVLSNIEAELKYAVGGSVGRSNSKKK